MGLNLTLNRFNLVLIILLVLSPKYNHIIAIIAGLLLFYSFYEEIMIIKRIKSMEEEIEEHLDHLKGHLEDVIKGKK